MNNEWITVMWVFFLGLIFSAVGWLHTYSRSEDYNDGRTTVKVKVEGSTHTIIGGGLSVLFYSAAQFYFPDWSMLLQAGAGIAIGSLLSEAVIKFAERRLSNE